MAKKKKLGKNEALNELKSLESKWLKDRRIDDVEPIQSKVMAAKVAALIDYVEQNGLDVSFDNWPPMGAEELIRMERPIFEQSVTHLQKAGVLNSSMRLLKAAAKQRDVLEIESEDGILTYRCVKPGGINLTDRDEYIAEDQEVTYTEEAIGESDSLQTAIANEWLMRIETPKSNAESND
jgi:hypothetical protein